MGNTENTERILAGLTFIEACDNSDMEMMQVLLDNVSASDLLLGVTKASLVMFRANQMISDGNLSAYESIQKAREGILLGIASADADANYEEI